jgi:hypothetical protein
MRIALLFAAFAAMTLPAACAKAGGQTDNLYGVETRSTPGEVKAGEKGQAEIKIRVKDGAHISEEAPLKIALSGKNVKLEKQQLSKADQAKQPDGPKFEVPFTAEQAGQGSVECDMTFYVCTEKLCERQTKKISIPVSVK